MKVDWMIVHRSESNLGERFNQVIELHFSCDTPLAYAVIYNNLALMRLIEGSISDLTFIELFKHKIVKDLSVRRSEFLKSRFNPKSKDT